MPKKILVPDSGPWLRIGWIETAWAASRKSSVERISWETEGTRWHMTLAAGSRERTWVLSIKRDGNAALQRRYVLTVVDTALMVVSLWVVVLLDVPTPDIVYKAF